MNMMPLPGVMMMLLAFIMCSTAPSTFTSVWVPVISLGFPVPVDDVPKPPIITFISDLFMACKTQNWWTLEKTVHELKINKIMYMKTIIQNTTHIFTYWILITIKYIWLQKLSKRDLSKIWRTRDGQICNWNWLQEARIRSLNLQGLKLSNFSTLGR